MLSPILFTLYTNDCRKVHPNNSIFKFADDTAIVSLLHKDTDSCVYHNEINAFIKWCDKNRLILNVLKTQEMVFDPRQVILHEPVVIKDQTINQVTTYKYLGVHVDNLFSWKAHIDNLCSKLQQRLCFLRRLRLWCQQSDHANLLQSYIRKPNKIWNHSLVWQPNSTTEKQIG